VLLIIDLYYINIYINNLIDMEINIIKKVGLISNLNELKTQNYIKEEDYICLIEFLTKHKYLVLLYFNNKYKLYKTIEEMMEINEYAINFNNTDLCHGYIIKYNKNIHISELINIKTKEIPKTPINIENIKIDFDFLNKIKY
jgi:hypothetical protein